MHGTELFLIVIGWVLAAGSPGPATLAISGTAMSEGRAAGLAIGAGVLTGSAFWGSSAALGMSAIMVSNAWVFEVVRYAGAAYLLYLALKSLRSALRQNEVRAATPKQNALFFKGLLIHLTNPKAVLAWGAIYAIALPSGAEPAQVWQLLGVLICVSAFIFLSYGVLFSLPAISRGYLSLRRWFDGLFALLFGAASLKILTARLEF